MPGVARGIKKYIYFELKKSNFEKNPSPKCQSSRLASLANIQINIHFYKDNVYSNLANHPLKIKKFQPN